MKKHLKNYMETIKNLEDLEINSTLVKGSILFFTTLIILLFERKIGALTILYLFPISLIILAIENICYANKSKELNMKNWIISVISSIILLLIVLYLVFNPIITKDIFLIVFSAFIIYFKALKYLRKEKHSLIDYLDVSILSIIAILTIIFNSYILDNLYIYLVIFYMIYGLLKIVFSFIISSYDTNK